MRILLPLGFLLLALAACSSNGDNSLDSGATSSPVTPTLDADESSTLLDDIEGLANYFLVSIRTDRGVNEANAEVMEAFLTDVSNQEVMLADLAKFERDLSSVLETALTDLEALTPPANIAEIHQAQLESIRSTNGQLEDLAVAVENEDAEAAISAISGLSGQVTGALSDRDAYQAAFVAVLSSDGLDDVDEYILAVEERKIEYAERVRGYLEDIQTARSSDQFIEANNTVILELTRHLANLRFIEPPRPLEQLHADEIGLVGQNIDVQQEFSDAIESDDPEALARANLSGVALTRDLSLLAVLRDDVFLSQIEAVISPSPSP
jgi:hypothetical protein